MLVVPSTGVYQRQKTNESLEGLLFVLLVPTGLLLTGHLWSVGVCLVRKCRLIIETVTVPACFNLFTVDHMTVWNMFVNLWAAGKKEGGIVYVHGLCTCGWALKKRIHSHFFPSEPHTTYRYLLDHQIVFCVKAVHFRRIWVFLYGHQFTQTDPSTSKSWPCLAP